MMTWIKDVLNLILAAVVGFVIGFICGVGYYYIHGDDIERDVKEIRNGNNSEKKTGFKGPCGFAK